MGMSLCQHSLSNQAILLYAHQICLSCRWKPGLIISSKLVVIDCAENREKKYAEKYIINNLKVVYYPLH